MQIRTRKQSLIPKSKAATRIVKAHVKFAEDLYIFTTNFDCYYNQLRLIFGLHELSSSFIFYLL